MLKYNNKKENFMTKQDILELFTLIKTDDDVRNEFLSIIRGVNAEIDDLMFEEMTRTAEEIFEECTENDQYDTSYVEKDANGNVINRIPLQLFDMDPKNIYIDRPRINTQDLIDNAVKITVSNTDANGVITSETVTMAEYFKRFQNDSTIVIEEEE